MKFDDIDLTCEDRADQQIVKIVLIKKKAPPTVEKPKLV